MMNELVRIHVASSQDNSGLLAVVVDPWVVTTSDAFVKWNVAFSVNENPIVASVGLFVAHVAAMIHTFKVDCRFGNSELCRFSFDAYRNPFFIIFLVDAVSGNLKGSQCHRNTEKISEKPLPVIIHRLASPGMNE